MRRLRHRRRNEKEWQPSYALRSLGIEMRGAAAANGPAVAAAG